MIEKFCSFGMLFFGICFVFLFSISPASADNHEANPVSFDEFQQSGVFDPTFADHIRNNKNTKNLFVQPQKGSTTQEIRRVFYKNILPIFKYLFAFGAVLIWIVYITMLIGSGGSEDTIKQQQKNLLWGIVGFLVVSLAISFGDVLTPADNARDIIQIDESKNLIQKIIGFVQMLVTIISLLVIFYSGVNFIRSQGDEGDLETSKKYFQWALMGIVIVMLSEPIVNNVFYPADQTLGSEEVASLAQETGGVLRFFLIFIALAAFITLIIAGAYSLGSFGNEDSQKKSREILVGTLTGIVIVISAYVLVAMFLPSS